MPFSPYCTREGNGLRKFNKWLARKATLIFGTMWMFYAFFVYGLLPLMPALSPYEGAFFYWSGWVQLWALPLLMVGQNVLGEAAEKREQETHDAVMQELKLVRTTVKMLHAEQKEIRQLVQLGGGKFDC